MIEQLMDSILQIVFPEKCLGCKLSGSAICPGCLKTIPCAKTLHTPEVCAVFDYSNVIVRKAIHELKYNRHSASAKILAHSAVPWITHRISQAIQSEAKNRIIFIPIPLHPSRLRERGFNQSVLLAHWYTRGLKNAFHVSTLNLLTKTIATAPQVIIKNRTERLHNIAHTMHTTHRLDSTTLYIVVDDVSTTGATFQEAKRALLSAGAKNILCIALAHGAVTTITQQNHSTFASP